jgi:hypothetical protein
MSHPSPESIHRLIDTELLRQFPAKRKRRFTAY